MCNSQFVVFTIARTGLRAKSLMAGSLFAVATIALAQSGGELQTIWRCVNPDGKTHVTNVREETIGNTCQVIQSQMTEENRRIKITALQKAESTAVIACRDKATCDKAFSLTQLYINQTSDLKIQIATDTIVETYNPTDDGKMGLQAMRIPGKGTSASVRLIATCKSERFAFDSCLLKKTNAYDGFRPFIERMLKE